MKVPKTFIPRKSLDGKTEEYLRKTEKKTVKEKGKRKIIIDTCKRQNIDDVINVHLDDSVKVYVYGSQRIYMHCTLDIASQEHFYFPVSDNPLDWSNRIKTGGTAVLKTEEKLLNYLNILQENNQAMLLWEPHENLIKLKIKFDNKYPNSMSDWTYTVDV